MKIKAWMKFSGYYGRNNYRDSYQDCIEPDQEYYQTYDQYYDQNHCDDQSYYQNHDDVNIMIRIHVRNMSM